jgi:hypothetical protein
MENAPCQHGNGFAEALKLLATNASGRTTAAYQPFRIATRTAALVGDVEPTLGKQFLTIAIA